MDRKKNLVRIVAAGLMSVIMVLLGTTSPAMAEKDPCTWQCD